MTTTEKTQFASLLIAILAFVATQFWTILQRSKQDRRGNLKLRLFQLLGDESLGLEEIKRRYHAKHGRVLDTELEKAIYEMLVDKTAYYEWTRTYRARWRNPKGKDKNLA